MCYIFFCQYYPRLCMMELMRGFEYFNQGHFAKSKEY